MPEVQVNKYAKIIVSVIDTYMYYKSQNKMGTGARSCYRKYMNFDRTSIF